MPAGTAAAEWAMVKAGAAGGVCVLPLCPQPGLSINLEQAVGWFVSGTGSMRQVEATETSEQPC